MASQKLPPVYFKLLLVGQVKVVMGDGSPLQFGQFLLLYWIDILIHLLVYIEDRLKYFYGQFLFVELSVPKSLEAFQSDLIHVASDQVHFRTRVVIQDGEVGVFRVKLRHVFLVDLDDFISLLLVVTSHHFEVLDQQ